MNAPAEALRSPVVPLASPKAMGPGAAVSYLELGGLELGAPFSSSLFTVEPGHSSPLDTHQDSEIWMVASGRGELEVGGQTLPLAARQVFCFHPHVPHSVRNTGAEALVIFSVWWLT